MWKCHKCGKPVYFAERKQSLGYDWHPECLRCEECGKRLNPGQHAEHKGVPYCHVPCYGALFGPQLFGHGTRVESHKSYGVRGAQKLVGVQSVPALPRDHLETKLKAYNQFYDNKSMEIRSREVNNRLILEGALRVYWGVQGVIHLKEDDDQRTFVVRKRNSCRLSKAENDNCSDKENHEISESYEAPTTTSDQVEAISTDVSLSDSMTFDSCSLNEYQELPTTPEEPSANITDNNNSHNLINGTNFEGDMHESLIATSTMCDSSTTTITNNTNNGISCTLPSKLENCEKLKWDEIDDLLQVERRVSEKDNIYETMPERMQSTTTPPSQNSSSSNTSTNNSPTQPTISNEVTSNSANSNSNSNSSSFSSSPSKSNNHSSATTSSDNFLTASASLANTTTTTETTTTLDNYVTSDDATLKPMDFEDFKRSVHQDYINGTNSFQEPNDDTLKRNQPIDPSRIHDSLKLYSAASLGVGNNPMSKSFNCEHALRSIDVSFINDTLTLKDMENSGGGAPSQKRSMYALQKSGSAQVQTQGHASQYLPIVNGRFEKGINRSKSGPTCLNYSDSDDDDDSTLKPEKLATIRKSNVPPHSPSRFIQIQMNCYPKESNKNNNNNNNNCNNNNNNNININNNNNHSNNSDCDNSSSRQSNYQSVTISTNSGVMAGDELTQSDEMYTATSNIQHSHDIEIKHNYTAKSEDDPPHVTEEGVILRKPPRTGASAIKRRSGNRRSRTKLKRRCSINGHFYNRETSFFTPPYGSQMSVWVTSLVTTQEVINLLLEKYKVDSPGENFSLFIIRDNGEQKRVKENDYPLLTRITLGPHEDVAKLFLVDARRTDEISNEVAQFINLSLPECRAILERYDQELDREVLKIKKKYSELRRRIVTRMESLKVHL